MKTYTIPCHRKHKAGAKEIVLLNCNVCGKEFERNEPNGTIICPECRGNTEKAKNRVYTKDTVALICMWYKNGDSINKIGRILGRSIENVEQALRIGGELE